MIIKEEEKKKEGEKIEDLPKEKEGEDGSKANAPATIVVELPADAQLVVDGYTTRSTTARRVFQSPVLEAGKVYHYNLKAEVVREGRTVTREQRVAVEAGKQSQITFDFANKSVASR